jgi:hypothetical protein
VNRVIGATQAITVAAVVPSSRSSGLNVAKAIQVWGLGSRSIMDKAPCPE